MGGGGYSRDVDEGRSSSRSSFTFSQDRERERRANPQAQIKEVKISPQLDPKKKKWECRDIPGEHPIVTPIALIIDGTSSRGEDVKIAFDKAPLLVGQILMHRYADHPEISIACVGDTEFDRFPVQISDFESDERIDKNLKALVIEEGGGGNGIESYATIVFGYAKYSDLDANKRGKKGYMFILGDEGFNKVVTKKEIKNVYGVDVDGDIEATEVFRAAQEKYNVFFIYVKKSWETRKKGIDAEIKKRVEQAGGMYEGVDIRASLLWNNRNDLDIHVKDPCGHHIYYGSYCKGNNYSPAPCGGFLDVDQNVRGQTTKPVENVRWPKGKAPAGHYRIWVENYAFHESKHGSTPFKAEIEINGVITHVEGETPANMTHDNSAVLLADFEYDPNERNKKKETKEDPYSAYKDDVVLGQWKQVLPEENIIILEDPKAIVDAMLGAIKITEGGSLDDYIVDMKERRQTDGRRAEIKGALAGLSGAKTATVIEKSGLPKKPVKKAGR